jgi:hypothetical protein
MTDAEKEAAAKAAEEKAAADKKAADEAAAAKAKADEEAAATLGDAGKAALAAERKAKNDAEKRAKAAEAKLKEIEDADASDLDKATKRAEEAEAKVQTLTENVRRARLIVELAKPEHALVDAAAAAALMTGVEYDDDGEPTNVADAVKAVTAKYEFLKGAPPVPKPAEINPGGGAGGSGGSGPALTAEELSAAKAANMSPEEWAHYKYPQAGPFVAAKT